MSHAVWFEEKSVEPTAALRALRSMRIHEAVATPRTSIFAVGANASNCEQCPPLYAPFVHADNSCVDPCSLDVSQAVGPNSIAPALLVMVERAPQLLT